jgi:hypothetical protein
MVDDRLYLRWRGVACLAAKIEVHVVVEQGDVGSYDNRDGDARDDDIGQPCPEL